MPHRTLTRDEHFLDPGPKRILALDGGGLRGILTLGILRRVEAVLRERHGRGDEARARRLLDSIERAQELLGGGQTVGGRALPERSGVVSASSPLDTGFGFGYYPYRHLGATAWYLMAAVRANPLRV